MIDKIIWGRMKSSFSAGAGAGAGACAFSPFTFFQRHLDMLKSQLSLWSSEQTVQIHVTTKISTRSSRGRSASCPPERRSLSAIFGPRLDCTLRTNQRTSPARSLSNTECTFSALALLPMIEGLQFIDLLLSSVCLKGLG
jgi:hypothetical protein